MTAAIDTSERLRRWRLALGSDAEGSCGGLTGGDARMDAALAGLYGGGSGGGGGKMARSSAARSAGLGSSAPTVARWLGDIREFFPTSVVQLMQQDAIERLNLKQLLLEPELLESVEADVHLVGTLLSLNKLMPE